MKLFGVLKQELQNNGEWSIPSICRAFNTEEQAAAYITISTIMEPDDNKTKYTSVEVILSTDPVVEMIKDLKSFVGIKYEN